MMQIDRNKLTADQNHLVTIEGRIDSLKANKTEGWQRELERMQVAHADVLSKLSEEEVAGIRALDESSLTDKQRAARRAKDEAEMEMNKDKNSI